jgi:multisubunit Na+/H+ antiporter MnhF subunit
MFNDPPRFLLSIIATVLGGLFFASIIFAEYLPDRILGINKILCSVFLIIGAISANWGRKLLDWIRRWSDRNKEI